ncbi:MAG TPA: enoyl-CoA hydratase/isomerase family protein [Caulobacter sp.]|nr:enoyl-CoA hydratase/isomerase family protein [Caulobacter sp.]
MTPRLERFGGTVVLTLDRPPVNALDLQAVLALEAAFDELTAAPPEGGLVLTGTGRAFSAGVDTRAFGSYGADDRAAMIRGITRMIGRLYGLPCPVAAAVNGHALGGGFVLMLACDARLASPGDARLGLTEAQAGVPFPAGPLEVIRAELGPDLLRRLTLTSETLSPAELAQRGAIDGLVEGDLVAAAVERVAAMARQPAFAQVKAQLRAPVVARLKALAGSGEDPLIQALGG